MGELIVRRRLEPTLQIDVYEVKLGDEFLITQFPQVCGFDGHQASISSVMALVTNRALMGNF